jgi:hypothetical protein
MIDVNDKMIVRQAIERFSREKDYVGLWQLINFARRAQGLSGPMQEPDRSLVDSIVAGMLSAGFLAIDLTDAGGYKPWPDQSQTAVLTRLNAEWTALGRPPSVHEVAWFLPPPQVPAARGCNGDS